MEVAEHEPAEALVAAMGHGGDEVEALLDLWATLQEHEASPDAIAHVAEAFTRRTGKAPR